MLAEIQTVINNRPLTILYDEPVEEVHHLLIGRKINLENILKSISFNNEDLYKRSKHLHNLSEHFRNRWRTEYLTKLRENQNCKVKDHECKIKEEVVVIIHDEKKSCALWSVAEVEKIINRLLNKLYPIEPNQ